MVAVESSVTLATDYCLVSFSLTGEEGGLNGGGEKEEGSVQANIYFLPYFGSSGFHFLSNFAAKWFP